jgi:hypothetical protein
MAQISYCIIIEHLKESYGATSNVFDQYNAGNM